MSRNVIRTTLLTLAAALGVAASAEAQRPVELGVDGILARVTSDGGDATMLAVPFGRARAAFLVADNIAIEPRLGLSWADFEGSSETDLTLGVGLLYQLKTDPKLVRPFIEVNGQLQYVKYSVDDLDVDESATQFALGGGVGVKVPMVDRLDLRLEGFVQQAFETDDFESATTFGLAFGLSFYTR